MLQEFNEKNRDLMVNISGVLKHRDEAGISPFDSLAQGGDSVWEGLRLYNGRIFKLTEHLDRLRRSAQALHFPEIPSHERITEEIKKTLQANGMTDGVHIRLTLSRGVKITSGMDPRLNQSGPTLIVLAEHKSPVYDKTGIRLITSSFQRPGPEVLDQRIHSNNLLTSILAKIEATAAGADDALLLDQRGFVAETNATHLFFVTHGRVETSTTVACPEGITRTTVLQLCADHGIDHAERDIRLDEAVAADEVFCTGTMGELAPVTTIDGQTIGTGAMGPVTQGLCDRFARLTATEGVQVV